MAESKIEWTDSTWNPVAGCSIVSPGCLNCYAMKMAHRLEKMGQAKYTGLTKRTNGKAVWNGTIRLDEAALQIPLKKKKPTRYFVNSMSDLFHEGVPDAFIDKVFAVMALCPQHTFQILTKRAERMAAYMNRSGWASCVVESYCGKLPDIHQASPFHSMPFPLPNVWLGVSAEDQQRADERIPWLLKTPAAVRFVSYEPALEAVDFGRVPIVGRGFFATLAGKGLALEKLHWVIVGGESGPGARPFDINWARSVVDQCKAAAGVAVFVKQMGARPFDYETAIDGWDKKGNRVALWPKELQVREFPR